MRTIVVALAFASALVPAASAHASVHRSLAQRYTDYRFAVKHRFGARTPGRNIRRDGVWTEHGSRPATRDDYLRSIATLRSMLHPVTSSTVVYPASTSTNTSTASVAYSGSSLEQCILAHEGAGPTTVNSSGHMGIGQWDQSTWVAQGGTRYAPTPVQASYGQQKAVLEQALANGHADAWRPYDGC